MKQRVTIKYEANYISIGEHNERDEERENETIQFFSIIADVVVIFIHFHCIILSFKVNLLQKYIHVWKIYAIE